MNTSLTTLDLPPATLQASPVLAQDGFTCTLLTLEPDTETPLPASVSRDDQLLFVVEGEIAVHADGLTTLVRPGGACLVKPATSPVLATRTGEPARVLRVEIPPRQVITPQLITPRV
jgi:mannose-6-phosphate isomerase-like protein (cupin superfamily)